MYVAVTEIQMALVAQNLELVMVHNCGYKVNTILSESVDYGLLSRVVLTFRARGVVVRSGHWLCTRFV